MPQIRLGLIGSSGRMGTALLGHLQTEPDIALLASLTTGGDLAVFLASLPDVVVDLSTGPGVDQHGPAIVQAGLPYVVGATGYAPATLDRLRSAADDSNSPVLIVPNFSLGANLMIAFAAKAAALMHSPVVTERHHQGKADAPSGTAVFTAQRIAATAVDQPAGGDKPSTAGHFHEQHTGALGAAVAGVPVHSLRGSGYLAEQEVRLCLPGEMLCIEHRTLDRRCFMPGVVYAIRNIGRVQGLQVGLDTIMEGV